jgi:hypothetical protein
MIPMREGIANIIPAKMNWITLKFMINLDLHIYSRHKVTNL